MKQQDELAFTVEDDIGYIFLNRPDLHNAINRSMWSRLPGMLEKLKSEKCRVIVIGARGKSFAAGADLSELSRLETYESARDYWFAIRDCLRYLWSFDLITIAMINGACLGGGCLLALACDLRYAGSKATFSLPVSRLGIVLDDENISRLVNLVGPGSAKELIYTGATISGAEALSRGLVNGLAEPADLQKLVHERAREIAQNSPASLAQAKLSISRSTQGAAGIQDEREVIESYLTDDFRQRSKRHFKTT